MDDENLTGNSHVFLLAHVTIYTVTVSQCHCHCVIVTVTSDTHTCCSYCRYAWHSHRQQTWHVVSQRRWDMKIGTGC